MKFLFALIVCLVTVSAFAWPAPHHPWPPGPHYPAWMCVAEDAYGYHYFARDWFRPRAEQRAMMICQYNTPVGGCILLGCHF